MESEDPSTEWRELLISLVKRYHPGERRDLSGATLLRREVNRSCGDTVTVYRRAEESPPREPVLLLEVQGCAVCKASAAIAEKVLPLLPATQGGELCRDVLRCIEGKDPGDRLRIPSELPEDLARDLLDLLAVRRAPARRRCATLGWEAALAALALTPPDPSGTLPRHETRE